jgi:hypothetical protein
MRTELSYCEVLRGMYSSAAFDAHNSATIASAAIPTMVRVGLVRG